MLSQKTLEKIIHESNNGGVQNFHPEISFAERKVLLSYLLKGGKCLDTCYLCSIQKVGA
jgi:hypothetical protein